MTDDPAPYLQQAELLSQAIEANAWDGEWYLRAFYDDGSPLGSHENIECQIDSIAQSWAVLSGLPVPVKGPPINENATSTRGQRIGAKSGSSMFVMGKWV
jgi:hypothetical protein